MTLALNAEYRANIILPVRQMNMLKTIGLPCRQQELVFSLWMDVMVEFSYSFVHNSFQTDRKW